MNSNDRYLGVLLAFALLGVLPCSALAAERQVSRASDSYYRLEVADGEEISLLRQELHVDIVRSDARSVVIRSPSRQLLERLRRYGYSPVQAAPEDVLYRLVRVSRTDARPESALLNTGVILLNREKGWWTVRGSLRQLEVVSQLGFEVRELDREPRPRIVEIVVPSRADVQSVYDLGVDIFHVAGARARNLRITGSAFDGQIDRMRRLGFTVSVK